MSSKVVAIYARYSSDKQSENSIEDQVRRCKELLVRSGDGASEVKVFADYAVSGASRDRPQFEAMMTEAKGGKLSSIVVEDLDRLSRDWADSGAIFKELEYARVPLKSASGYDSSRKGSQVEAMAKSMVAALYLSDLKDKTLRGLEGRFLKGFATGGVPYGFRTERTTEGASIAFDENAVQVVRRIFEQYRDGKSFAAIAIDLNSSGVPSPRAKTKHGGSRGWTAITVRSILDNEKYIGRWAFKKTEWIKKPGTNNRTPRRREASEVMTSEVDALRVVSVDLWEAVRKRRIELGTLYAKGGFTRQHYLFSGILRCGLCGGPMSIAGKKPPRYYCQDRRKRGTCTNMEGFREDVVRPMILEALKDNLTRPEAVAYLKSEIARRLGEVGREIDKELKERRARLARTEDRIKGLIGFIADGDQSPYVRQTLQDLEASARSEKEAISSLEGAAAKPISLSEVDTLLSGALDLEERFKVGDPAVGRLLLKEIFADGSILCHPQEGGWRLSSEILPLKAVIRGSSGGALHPLALRIPLELFCGLNPQPSS